MTQHLECPTAKWLRDKIEHYVLDLYESDGVTLRPEGEWPGYYQLTNNVRIPAVYVVGRQNVPSDWRPVGIECTIDEDPMPTPKPAYGMSYAVETWSFRFTNYGILEGTQMPSSLLGILRRLPRVFPNGSFTPTPRSEVAYQAISCRVSRTILAPLIP